MYQQRNMIVSMLSLRKESTGRISFTECFRVESCNLTIKKFSSPASVFVAAYSGSLCIGVLRIPNLPRFGPVGEHGYMPLDQELHFFHILWHLPSSNPGKPFQRKGKRGKTRLPQMTT